MANLLSRTLFIDIETAPLYRSTTHIPSESLLEHWEDRYTKDRSKEDDPDKHFLQKAAIHALYGRVICIGLGWLRPLGGPDNRWEWREKQLFSLDEVTILQEFIRIWEQHFWIKAGDGEVPVSLCGHNLISFDYVFLGRRMLLNGLPLPEPWVSTLIYPHWTIKQVRLLDTMRMWGLGVQEDRSFISLELLAQALQIPFSKGLTHDEIRDHFFRWTDAGDEAHFEPVLAYCAEDIRTTAKIYLKMFGLTQLIPYIQSSKENTTSV